MNRRLLATAAAITTCFTASMASAQVPALVNGNLDKPAPYLQLFFPNPGSTGLWEGQGFRHYNYAPYRWIGDGFSPAAQTHSGIYAYEIQGGLGRANGEFEGIETENGLDLSNSSSLFDWPAYHFDPSVGPAFTLSCWFMIPADDPMVGSFFGLKVGFHRSGTNLASHYWDYEWQDVNPDVAPAPTFPDDQGTPTQLTIVSTPNGAGIHTNGKWLHIVHTFNQSQFCVCSVPLNATSCATAPNDPGCPIFTSPPTNPAYVSFLALRFTTVPAPNQANTFGTVWVDDLTFSQGTAGSCCTTDGSCTTGTLAACASPNQFLPGGTCTTTTCPALGSCCINGACTAPVFQASCTEYGNLWTSIENGGSCSPSACRVVCCDGSDGCTFVLATDCTGSVGTGTSCNGTPCQNGACCDISTGTCTNTIQSSCLTPSTRFQPSITCGTGTCPAVGACCSSTNTCTTYAQANCAGTYRGNGTTCSPSPCVASGVCCRGLTCNTSISQASCTGANQLFVSGGGTCNGATNYTTPCCYADFNKVSGTTVQDIFDFLNAWFAGNPFAQFGGDGTSTNLAVQDIFSFLNAWFAGC